MDEITIYSDGGSRGNPGKAASAYVVFDKSGNVIHEFSMFLGQNTNNVAEYTAMIKALMYAKEKGYKRIICYSDSQLMIKQVLGEYKVKALHLKEFHAIIVNLAKDFESITFNHVKREDPGIKRADYLVNQCLDDNSFI